MNDEILFSLWEAEVKDLLNKTGLAISYRKKETGNTLPEKYKMPAVMCYTNETGRLTVAFDENEVRGFFTPVNGAKSSVRYKEAFANHYPDPAKGAVFVINKDNEFVRTSYILDTPFETIVSGYKEKSKTMSFVERAEEVAEREM